MKPLPSQAGKFYRSTSFYFAILWFCASSLPLAVPASAQSRVIKRVKFGLTSPAGMEQGRFLIEPQGAGKLSATNGFGNAGLFRGLNSQLQAKSIPVAPEVREMITKRGTGPVSLEHLKSLIRT